MVKTQTLPQWATLDRRHALIKLWAEYGNKCLYGHRTCPILSHYIYKEPKAVEAIVPVTIRCKDRNDNPIIVDGKQLEWIVYKTKPITVYIQKVSRLYNLKSELVIEGWKALDREVSKTLWEVERKALHSLGERTYPIRGQFSAISRDIYAETQPLYYLDGQSVSGLTFTPFVRVRIASSYIRLYVDLGDILRQVSKSQRRKAIRYGKPLPSSVKQQISQKVLLAVKDYYSH